MTVYEYRTKNPNCIYCRHSNDYSYLCKATGKKISKRTARKCPCYEPMEWLRDKEEGAVQWQSILTEKKHLK